MKKVYALYAAALIVLASLPGFSQTEKGNFLIGGTVTASQSTQTVSSTDFKSSGFGVSPSVSYFVADRFAAGVITNYSYSTSSSGSVGGTVNSHSQGAGLGPTVRYYFPLGEKIWLFPEMDYLWGWNHTQIESTTVSDGKSNSHTFRAGAGVAYFIAKNVGIEGLVYYQNLNNDNTNSSATITTTTSSTTSGIYFRVGLQVYILRNR